MNCSMCFIRVHHYQDQLYCITLNTCDTIEPAELAALVQCLLIREPWLSREALLLLLLLFLVYVFPKYRLLLTCLAFHFDI